MAMYHSFYKFSGSPFENNLDQRFLFLGKDHQEVLAALLYFIETKKGLAMVCGDAGTGKTMLINAFLDRLPETVKPIIIPNPRVSPQDLLAYVAKALEINPAGANVLELTDEIKDALGECRRQGIQVVVIIDDAHRLADPAWEEIRLLANLEAPEHKLLHILLVGQYALSHNLNRPELQDLRQRINVNRFLAHLDASGTSQYIDHRLQQVGSSFAAVFGDKGKGQLFKITQGIPRVINQLCDNALLIAMAEELSTVNRKTLRKAEEALETDRILTPPAGTRTKSSGRGKYGAILIPVATGVALVLLGTLAVKSGFRPGRLQPLAGTVASAGQPAPGITSNSLPAAIPEKRAPGPEKDLVSPQETKTSPGTPAAVKPERESSVTAALPASPFEDQVVTQAGETLSGIAAAHYPKDKKWGLVAIILQNPTVTNEDSIIAGEVISLPKLNPKNRTIQLNDKLFYGLYGRYTSPERAEKIASWLKSKKINFLVRDMKSGGNTVQRIFLGGYPTEEELEQVHNSLITQKTLK